MARRTAKAAGRALSGMMLVLLAACAGALEDVHLSQNDFLAGAFSGRSVDSNTLTVGDELRWRLADVLDRPFRERKIRFWRGGARTAWVLDQIGKERPITIGVVVENARIVSIAVLTYRETHGDEVADRRFTDRFTGASLADADRLDRDIDNITGATLSVRSMTRVARAALVLDTWSRRDTPDNNP